MIEVTEKIAIEHGLKKDEYKKICELLKRNPKGRNPQLIHIFY